MSELPLVDLGIRSRSSRKRTTAAAVRMSALVAELPKPCASFWFPRAPATAGCGPPAVHDLAAWRAPCGAAGNPAPKPGATLNAATQTTRVILNAAASPPKGRAAQRDRVHALSAQPGQNILRTHTHTHTVS